VWISHVICWILYWKWQIEWLYGYTFVPSQRQKVRDHVWFILYSYIHCSGIMGFLIHFILVSLIYRFSSCFLALVDRIRSSVEVLIFLNEWRKERLTLKHVVLSCNIKCTLTIQNSNPTSEYSPNRNKKCGSHNFNCW
jgi:hypothetical protein